MAYPSQDRSGVPCGPNGILAGYRLYSRDRTYLIWFVWTKQVLGALKTAMAKARRVRNVPGSTTSIGGAFKLGAEVIHSRNDDAVPVAGTKRRDGADAGASTGETMTLGDIETFIKAARQGDGKGSEKTAATKTVEIEVNGVKKPYKVVQGGNRGCPVACTKKHAKGAKCAWNHSDK